MQRAYDSESMSLVKARKLNNIAISPSRLRREMCVDHPRQPATATSVANP